ncbi:MAG: DNA alkylation repair protein [Gammaproteobacteria bacterium]|nr:DNA alkylation repair protein [Gammaproteobacteria bacterium]
MASRHLMKDGLDNRAVKQLAKSLANTWPAFPTRQFEHDAINGLKSLELKQRVRHLVAVMHRHLPQDFRKAVPILVSLKDHWNDGRQDDVWRSFAAWPILDYIGTHGLDRPSLALDALQQLTSLFTAEFAIRPFIAHHRDLTLTTLEHWCQHDDHHVRRLVSEGTRPRLPWGTQLADFVRNPRPVLPLLEQLKDDPSDYVRRSVANNLNDISKDHPDIMIRMGKKWLRNAGKERQWIVRHAARSLIKAGHPHAFALLGYSVETRANKCQLVLERKKIYMGETLEFSVALKAPGTRPLDAVIDYRIDFVKANGSSRPKVFKLRNVHLSKGETVNLKKLHSFKFITTRRYYPGRHGIAVTLNGREICSDWFELL